MDYPHGHVGHHSHHTTRRDDNDDNQFPGPPPPFSHNSPFPPPPSFGNPNPMYEQSYPPPPQPSYGGPYDNHPTQNYPPPQHTTSHHGYQEEEPQHHHGFKPHMPSFGGHTSHHENASYEQPYSGGSNHDSYGPHTGGPTGGSGMGVFDGKTSYRIDCKASGDRYALAVRHDKVVLTHPDRNDPTQHWYKDESFSTKVKDKDGYPCFILVNKATGQAVKHSVSAQPVQLTPYRPGVFDESVMWTESKDLGSGYRTIRMVNNVKLVMDAFNGDPNHGGVHDGTYIALFESWRGDNQNQQWKLIPY